MARDDFAARLRKLEKSAPAKLDRANNARAEAADQRGGRYATLTRPEDDEIESASWIWVLLMFAFLYLSGLFVYDPVSAARQALVIVPIMVLIIAWIGVRRFRRGWQGDLLFQVWDNADFLTKILCMLR